MTRLPKVYVIVGPLFCVGFLVSVLLDTKEKKRTDERERERERENERNGDIIR